MTHVATVISVRRQPTEAWPERFDRIQELFAFFSENAGRRVGASRTAVYRNAFAAFRRAAESGDAMTLNESGSVIETMVEYDQLMKIMEAAKSSRRLDHWRRRLARLIAGTAYAKNESAKPSARDSQFECYLAAVFERSGLNVEFNEPDLLVRMDDATLGVAAKRPRHIAGLEKNCRSGARQVATTGSPGIIALDLSLALLRGTFVMPDTCEHAIDLMEGVVHRFIESQVTRLESFINGRASGLLLCVHLPALIGIPERPQLMTAVCWRFVTLTSDRRLARAITKLAAQSERGLFGPRTAVEVSSSSA